MMPDERLLELIGNIPEEMLDEALNMKKICRTRKKRVFYISVAAACMVVLLMRFVPVGQVMAAQIRKQVERLLEELFPPKDIPMTFEGMEENIPHEIYGELSTETEEFPKETEEISRENVDKAGFAIYVDMDSFETTEEAECHIIRGKPIVYTREDAIRNNEMLLADLSEEEAEQKIQGYACQRIGHVLVEYLVQSRHAFLCLHRKQHYGNHIGAELEYYGVLGVVGKLALHHIEFVAHVVGQHVDVLSILEFQSYHRDVFSRFGCDVLEVVHGVEHVLKRTCHVLLYILRARSLIGGHHHYGVGLHIWIEVDREF